MPKPTLVNTSATDDTAAPAPVRIPLSIAQQQRFASYEAELAAVTARKNEALTILVAGVMDPAQLMREQWQITITADAIVATPPAPAAE